MIDFILLLVGPLHVLLVIAGLAIAFWSVFKVNNILRGDVDLRESMNKAAFFFGVGLTVIGVSLYVAGDMIGPNASKHPRQEELAKRWGYVVHRDNGEFSHKGECDLTQEGDLIRLSGTRLYQCTVVDGHTECTVSRSPWKADWAQFCADGRLRFTYTINVPPNHQIHGFCDLVRRNGNKTLQGEYHLFQPIPESNPPVVDRGLITFTQLADGEEVGPPTVAEKLPKPREGK